MTISRTLQRNGDDGIPLEHATYKSLGHAFLAMQKLDIVERIVKDAEDAGQVIPSPNTELLLKDSSI